MPEQQPQSLSDQYEAVMSAISSVVQQMGPPLEGIRGGIQALEEENAVLRSFVERLAIPWQRQPDGTYTTNMETFIAALHEARIWLAVHPLEGEANDGRV